MGTVSGRFWRSAAAWAALAGFAASVAAPPASHAQQADEPNPVDFDVFWESAREMRGIAADGQVAADKLQALMQELGATQEAEKAKRLRMEVKGLLEEHRARKARLNDIASRCLKTPAPKKADIDILRKLRDTELLGIHWNKTKFIECLSQIGRAVDVRFVLHPDVLKFNTVEMDFGRVSAAGLLNIICKGFECEWLVYGGEVIVIKELKRNDLRFLKYLEKHPEWKYWEKDPAKPDAPMEDEE
jgi:hypothetical protein